MNTIEAKTINTIEAEEAKKTLEEAKTILDNAKKREAEAEAKAEAKKKREDDNREAEAEAKKTLRGSLDKLSPEDLLKRSRFTDGKAKRVRLLPFTKPYTAKDPDTGEALKLEASVKYTIFDRYGSRDTDTEASRKYKSSMRKAIAEAIGKLSLLASESPSKEDASEAVPYIREAVRLCGFGDYMEAINNTDAKKVLSSGYRLSDTGEDDAEDRDLKSAIQARLYRIVCGREEANAKREREDAKKREAEARKAEAEEAKKTLEEAKAEAKRIIEEAKAEAKKTLEEAKPKTGKKTGKKTEAK